MAEAYLRHFAKGKAEIFSAGIEIHGLNKKAVAIMKEDGLDISGHTSNHVNEYAGIDFDYVITVCDHAKEHCPYFATRAVRLHQNFPDPSKLIGPEEMIHREFIRVRQLIKQYCKDFVTQNL